MTITNKNTFNDVTVFLQKLRPEKLFKQMLDNYRSAYGDSLAETDLVKRAIASLFIGPVAVITFLSVSIMHFAFHEMTEGIMKLAIAAGIAILIFLPFSDAQQYFYLNIFSVRIFMHILRVQKCVFSLFC